MADTNNPSNPDSEETEPIVSPVPAPLLPTGANVKRPTPRPAKISTLIHAVRLKARGEEPPTDLLDVLAETEATELENRVRDIKAALVSVQSVFDNVTRIEGLGDEEAREVARRVAGLRQLLRAANYQPSPGGGVRVDESTSLDHLVAAVDDLNQLVLRAERVSYADKKELIISCGNAREALLKAELQGEENLVRARLQSKVTLLGLEIEHEKALEQKNTQRADLVIPREIASLHRDARIDEVRAQIDEERDRAALERQHRLLIGERELSHLRARAAKEIEGAVDDEFAEEELQLQQGLDSLTALRDGWVTPLLTGSTQLASWAMSTVGLVSLGTGLTDAPAVVVYGTAGVFAAGINGLLYKVTREHQSGTWTFFSKPEFAENRRWIPLWLPTGTAFIYVLASGMSWGSNAGGLMSKLAGPDIVDFAWGSNEDEVSDFIAQAREKNQGPTSEVNQLILDVQQAGNEMANESKGLGPSGRYGFKTESIKELAQFNVEYDKAARRIAELGQCESLPKLEQAYHDFVEQLRREQLVGGARYSTAVFEDRPLTANRQLCEENFPDNFSGDVDAIQELLEGVRNEIESDTPLQDPTLLNPRIKQLNRKMGVVAERINGMKGVEAEDAEALVAPELPRMDPPAMEGFKMIIRSWSGIIDQIKHLVEPEEGQGGGLKFPIYPALLSMLALAIDQFGLGLSFLIKTAQKHRLAQIRERRENLVRLKTEQKKPAELEVQKPGLGTRLSNWWNNR